MQAGFALTMRLRAEYQRTGNEIVALRALHDSLARASRRHGLSSDTAAALSALQGATNKALDASYTANTQSWEDTLRAGPGIYERILNVAQGIVGTDYRPTAGQTALADDIEMQMKSRLSDDDAIFGPRLANLNALLKRDNQPAITAKRE